MATRSSPTGCKREIIATKVANRFVNRLGIIAPFALTEEEGAAFGQVAAAFLAAERLFDMDALWAELDDADVAEQVRLALFDQAATGLQMHIADLLRVHLAGHDAGRDRRAAAAGPRQAERHGRRSAAARGARGSGRPARRAGRARRAARRSPTGSCGCSS